MTNPTSPDPASSKEQLAAEERRAGSLLADGPHRWILITCAAVYLIALFLPFAGSANGWQVLAATDTATVAETKVTEYLFTWFSFAGLGVLTIIAMLTRRYGLAALGWVVTAISLVFALMAVWLRRSSTAVEAGLTHGAGIYIAMLAVLVAVFAYLPAIFRRAEEQRAVTIERAAAQGTDEVAQMQRAASQHQENPLLIDDRRQRATQRHNRDAR